MNETPFTFIFYVGDVAKSCTFYTRVLGYEPEESSPNFALCSLRNGGKLGLWARHDVLPAVTSPGTSGELAFLVESKSKVDQIFALWKEGKASIAQQPATMDFGYTFTATDPDGNRVRVFSFPDKA
jgi:catechol 2,3-dioxygenase-like lactoylglutathione lyase family enzyme